MTKTLFALMLAGTFMVPPAIGNESKAETAGIKGAPSAQQRWDAFTLPAIPHLDTMPWLTRGTLTVGPKVDVLWPATPGPPLLELNIPPTRFSSTHPATHRTE
jgi:hypothetical protein